MTDGSTEQAKVLISGTFDVGNYGDLLFPIIAADRLGRLGYDVIPVAPTNTKPGFADAMPPRALVDVAESRMDFAGMLIGGGEIIHAWPARFVPEYQDSNLAETAYLQLWFGASFLASCRDRPIVWNAPGVPSVLPVSARRKWLEPAVAAADYISVRDNASVRALPVTEASSVVMVPDTVADLAKVWPLTSLSDAFKGFLRRHSLSGDERLFCIQLRPGGSGRDTAASIAERINRFATSHHLLPVLLSIGPSLGDGETLRAVAQSLKCRYLLLDAPKALREIAAVIGHARAYLGNSLHGYVTAVSYGVPGAIVGRPAFRKFAGFASQIGREPDVTPSWDAGLDRLAEILACGLPPTLGQALPVALERHWQTVIRSIATAGRERNGRAALLRSAQQLMNESARHSTWLAPIMGRTAGLHADAP